MADPVTLGIMGGVSMAGSAAGGIMGAIGGKQTAKAQAGQYTYQAGIADINKRIAEQNKDFALEGGERELVGLGLKQRAQMGQIRAQQGASGVSVNSGSNADVQQSQAVINAMDRDNARRNMMQKVKGYQNEAWSQGAQGDLYRYAARNAQKSGTINAITSLIGGATGVASKWSQGNSVGLYSGSGRGYNPTTLLDNV